MTPTPHRSIPVRITISHVTANVRRCYRLLRKVGFSRRDVNLIMMGVVIAIESGTVHIEDAS